MPQNLTTLLGAAGAARFLQLVASPVRMPAVSLKVYDPTGTTLVADVTASLVRASLEFSDETAAAQSRFTVENRGGQYDLYGGTSAAVFALNNRLVFRKGLTDPANGQVYLLPACVALVSQVAASYDRQVDLPVLEVVGLDLLKNPLRQRVTTDPYYNATPDQVAADVAVRYGGFTPAQLALGGAAAGLPAFPFVQFPDYALLDVLKSLYDPSLFYVRMREDGALQTGPRLGSAYSAMSGVLGYPDQAAAPPAAAVAYAFPDSPTVISAEQAWKDFESVNQVRVLGIAGSQVVTLGPVQQLATVSPSSVGPQQNSTFSLPYSDNGGGQNAVVGTGVYVVVSYSTDGSAFYSTTLGGPNHPGGQDVKNSDGHTCGNVTLLSVGPTEVVVICRGYQYSAGGGLLGGPVRHHGGFDFSLAVYGQPQVSASPAVTAIADYNPVAVAGESPVNDFGDGQTFQLAHSPVAMGTPVELQLAPSTLPTGVTVGAVRAGDQAVTLFFPGAAPQAGDVLKMAAPAGAATGPVEYLTLNTGGGAGGSSYPLAAPAQNAYAAGTAPAAVLSGVVSDDYSNLSPLFKVDFERGRIVLQTLIYRTITADTATPGMTLTATATPQGGNTAPVTVSNDFNVLGLAVQTPPALYQTFRECDLSFTFTGLTPGQGYSLRLHAVDPYSDGPGQRRFSVIWDATELVAGLDVWQAAGGGFTQGQAQGHLGGGGNNDNAYQQQIDGLVADSSGAITVTVGQYDPQLGDPNNPHYPHFLDSCKNNGDGTGAEATMGCVCGLEVLQPQAQGPEPFAVNVGGPALNASPPAMSVSYGYSPVQQQLGVQSLEIDNPLLRTRAQCRAVADFYLNYSAWSKSPVTLRAHSVPHLQAGDLIKFWNPKVNADVWAYVQGVRRTVDRAQAAGDTDEYSCFAIFAQHR